MARKGLCPIGANLRPCRDEYRSASGFWVSKTFCPEGRWRLVVAHISGVLDLAATARSFLALRRLRKLRRASDLLRLALLHGPGGLSSRASALAAGEAGLAESLSDKAVLGRLRQMGGWLEHVLPAGWKPGWPRH